MPYDNSTTGDHVSLLINQVDLLNDDHRRNALLEDLETAVKAVLAEHGLTADWLKTVSGHILSDETVDTVARVAESEQAYQDFRPTVYIHVYRKRLPEVWRLVETNRTDP